MGKGPEADNSFMRKSSVLAGEVALVILPGPVSPGNNGLAIGDRAYLFSAIYHPFSMLLINGGSGAGT